MDVATAQVAISTAQTQIAAAAKIIKMNAGADKAVATLVEEAAANLEAVVAAPPAGTGRNLDIVV